jgi:hypothetical protein
MSFQNVIFIACESLGNCVYDRNAKLMYRELLGAISLHHIFISLSDPRNKNVSTNFSATTLRKMTPPNAYVERTVSVLTCKC